MAISPSTLQEETIQIKPESLAQRRALRDKSQSLLFWGPWGSGKTHIGAAKALAVGWQIPNNHIALVRKKRVDLEVTLWKWFIDKILPKDLVVYKNDSKLERRLANGTEVVGAGLDSDEGVNKLASREYGFIVVEEARELTESDFEEKILRCLRLPTVPFHQVMLLTNPDAPAHWLYSRFFLNKQNGYNEIKSETLRHLLPESYLQRLDQLTGIFRSRYRDGEWVAAEGIVYPFDPTKHIIQRFRIPPDWQRVIAVDFGFDHPFVCHWWAISPSDAWYLYREIYHSRRTVRVHAQEINRLIEKDIEDAVRTIDKDLSDDKISRKKYDELRIQIQHNMRPSVVCDHDAEDTATLAESGLVTRPAQKDRLGGQQAVYDKFDTDRIFFFEDSVVEVDQRFLMEGKPTKTVDEFGTYVWANTKTKEDMVKQKDDGMDTMRYAIYSYQPSAPWAVIMG